MSMCRRDIQVNYADQEFGARVPLKKPPPRPRDMWDPRLLGGGNNRSTHVDDTEIVSNPRLARIVLSTVILQHWLRCIHYTQINRTVIVRKYTAGSMLCGTGAKYGSLGSWSRPIALLLKCWIPDFGIDNIGLLPTRMHVAWFGMYASRKVISKFSTVIRCHAYFKYISVIKDARLWIMVISGGP